jgi:hypothetical protein
MFAKTLGKMALIGKATLYPDFSQSLKKQGSKTAKMHIAQQFQQFEV